jgi:putative transposase
MKRKGKYWSGAHTKHRMLYHIVWIPKYRKRVLSGEIAVRIKELLQECADVNRWRIDELNIQRDHVHMLIQLRPDISVSKAVQLFKGKSSYMIRKEFPNLKEFYWGKSDSFWSDGFFVETVGQVNEAKIKEYIKNQ